MRLSTSTVRGRSVMAVILGYRCSSIRSTGNSSSIIRMRYSARYATAWIRGILQKLMVRASSQNRVVRLLTIWRHGQLVAKESLQQQGANGQQCRKQP